MFDSSSGRHVQSFTLENGREGGQEDYSNRVQSRSQGSRIGGDRPMHLMNIGSALKDHNFKGPVSCLDNIKGRAASHQGNNSMV